MSVEISNKSRIKETVIAGIVTGFFFAVCFIILAVTSTVKIMDKMLIKLGQALDRQPVQSEKEKP